MSLNYCPLVGNDGNQHYSDDNVSSRLAAPAPSTAGLDDVLQEDRQQGTPIVTTLPQFTVVSDSILPPPTISDSSLDAVFTHYLPGQLTHGDSDAAVNRQTRHVGMPHCGPQKTPADSSYSGPSFPTLDDSKDATSIEHSVASTQIVVQSGTPTMVLSVDQSSARQLAHPSPPCTQQSPEKTERVNGVQSAGCGAGRPQSASAAVSADVADRYIIGHCPPCLRDGVCDSAGSILPGVNLLLVNNQGRVIVSSSGLHMPQHFKDKLQQRQRRKSGPSAAIQASKNEPRLSDITARQGSVDRASESLADCLLSKLVHPHDLSHLNATINKLRRMKKFCSTQSASATINSNCIAARGGMAGGTSTCTTPATVRRRRPTQDDDMPSADFEAVWQSVLLGSDDAKPDDLSKVGMPPTLRIRSSIIRPSTDLMLNSAASTAGSATDNSFSTTPIPGVVGGQVFTRTRAITVLVARVALIANVDSGQLDQILPMWCNAHVALLVACFPDQGISLSSDSFLSTVSDVLRSAKQGHDAITVGTDEHTLLANQDCADADEDDYCLMQVDLDANASWRIESLQCTRTGSSHRHCWLTPRHKGTFGSSSMQVTHELTESTSAVPPKTWSGMAWIDDLVHPDDREHVTDAVMRATTSGGDTSAADGLNFRIRTMQYVSDTDNDPQFSRANLARLEAWPSSLCSSSTRCRVTIWYSVMPIGLPAVMAPVVSGMSNSGPPLTHAYRRGDSGAEVGGTVASNGIESLLQRSGGNGDKSEIKSNGIISTNSRRMSESDLTLKRLLSMDEQQRQQSVNGDSAPDHQPFSCKGNDPASMSSSPTLSNLVMERRSVDSDTSAPEIGNFAQTGTSVRAFNSAGMATGCPTGRASTVLAASSGLRRLSGTGLTAAKPSAVVPPNSSRCIGPPATAGASSGTMDVDEGFYCLSDNQACNFTAVNNPQEAAGSKLCADNPSLTHLLMRPLSHSATYQPPFLPDIWHQEPCEKLPRVLPGQIVGGSVKPAAGLDHVKASLINKQEQDGVKAAVLIRSRTLSGNSSNSMTILATPATAAQLHSGRATPVCGDVVLPHRRTLPLQLTQLRTGFVVSGNCTIDSSPSSLADGSREANGQHRSHGGDSTYNTSSAHVSAGSCASGGRADRKRRLKCIHRMIPAECLICCRPGQPSLTTSLQQLNHSPQMQTNTVSASADSSFMVNGSNRQVLTTLSRSSSSSGVFSVNDGNAAILLNLKRVKHEDAQLVTANQNTQEGRMLPATAECPDVSNIVSLSSPKLAAGIESNSPTRGNVATEPLLHCSSSCGVLFNEGDRQHPAPIQTVSNVDNMSTLLTVKDDWLHTLSITEPVVTASNAVVGERAETSVTPICIGDGPRCSVQPVADDRPSFTVDPNEQRLLAIPSSAVMTQASNVHQTMMLPPSYAAAAPPVVPPTTHAQVIATAASTDSLSILIKPLNRMNHGITVVSTASPAVANRTAEPSIMNADGGGVFASTSSLMLPDDLYLSHLLDDVIDIQQQQRSSEFAVGSSSSEGRYIPSPLPPLPPATMRQVQLNVDTVDPPLTPLPISQQSSEQDMQQVSRQAAVVQPLMLLTPSVVSSPSLTAPVSSLLPTQHVPVVAERMADINVQDMIAPPNIALTHDNFLHQQHQQQSEHQQQQHLIKRPQTMSGGTNDSNGCRSSLVPAACIWQRLHGHNPALVSTSRAANAVTTQTSGTTRQCLLTNNGDGPDTTLDLQMSTLLNGVKIESVLPTPLSTGNAMASRNVTARIRCDVAPAEIDGGGDDFEGVIFEADGPNISANQHPRPLPQVRPHSIGGGVYRCAMGDFSRSGTAQYVVGRANHQLVQTVNGHLIAANTTAVGSASFSVADGTPLLRPVVATSRYSPSANYEQSPLLQRLLLHQQQQQL